MTKINNIPVWCVHNHVAIFKHVLINNVFLMLMTRLRDIYAIISFIIQHIYEKIYKQNKLRVGFRGTELTWGTS